MSTLLATASSGQGIYAVATAVGGVAVSIFTVYKNAQKQAQYTGENTGHIQSLSEQIGMLNSQIIELKSQNVALTTELRLLRDSHEASQRRRPQEDSYEDDYEPPRRKKSGSPPPPRKKKK